MFLKKFKPTTLAVSLSLLFSAPTFAQQQPSGAGAAKGAAVGGVTAGTIAAAVAVVAVAAALSGGSSGAVQQGSGQKLNDGVVATVKEIGGALTALDAVSAAQPVLLANARLALEQAENAIAQSVQAQAELATARAAAGSRSVAELCGGKTFCSASDRLRISLVAAEKAKLAVEASYFAIAETRKLANALNLNPAQLTAFNTAIQAAEKAANDSKLVSDTIVDDHNKDAISAGSGTIAGISGTAGTRGPTGSTLSN